MRDLHFFLFTFSFFLRFAARQRPGLFKISAHQSKTCIAGLLELPSSDGQLSTAQLSRPPGLHRVPSHAIRDAQLSALLDLSQRLKRQGSAAESLPGQLQRIFQHEVRSRAAHERGRAAKERLRCLSQFIAATRRSVVYPRKSLGA